jgi:nondiscriminating aspartyl-tRNA synthetase
MRTPEEKEKGILAFAWVVNFPFFKEVEKGNAAEERDSLSGWTFTHNPFSSPIPEHMEWHKNGENIDKIVTNQYDLVCNGYEVGGGSIRAHDPEVLRQTYRIMGYSDEKIDASVGHMIEALGQGTPPHGGIALGVDRLVMLLTGESSLKETIAFPMTYNGRTSVMDAPNEISKAQLEELGISVKVTKPKNGEEMVEVIKNLLSAKGLEFDHMKHEETPTSEDSARVRGTKIEEGVKAIVLKGKKTGKNFLVNVPGHKKVNMKALEEVVGEKLEMEKPEVIKERYGLIIGGVPPFGNLMGIPNYYDKGILDEERSAFNCGLRTESIVMKSKDLVEVSEGVVGEFGV